MKVGLYARVSTRDKQNPEVQLRELREYAAKRGWEVTGEFVDSMSGTKDSRPQLDVMMKRAKARKLDAVVVWKLDRFGRSLRHLVNTLTELEAVGCAFVSITNGIDLSTPQGRLMFHIISAMGEFERELIRERVLSGLADARARGKQLGRPAVNRTYDKDAKKIKALRHAGDSYESIAGELGRSKSDIYRVCQTLGCMSAST